MDARLWSHAELTRWLDQVSVADEIFALCTDYCAGLMVISGLRSGPSDDASDRALERAQKSVGSAYEGDRADARAAQIERWKQTYAAFGAKPSRTRVSVDALSRRAASGGLPRINRVTDLYNSISVRRGVPIGVEDVDAYTGRLRLVRATGNELFETTRDGQPHEERPEPGEPVWRDDLGVTCRRWNWRQTPRTGLTEQTVNAVFVVDALGPESRDLAGSVLDDLEQAVDGDTTARRLITRPVE
ncbi:MAG: phenylalanine--tRNA ligase beta subunit-related protein [Ornithinimicrobium sp.]